jgi:hypothetical protein
MTSVMELSIMAWLEMAFVRNCEIVKTYFFWTFMGLSMLNRCSFHKGTTTFTVKMI